MLSIMHAINELQLCTEIEQIRNEMVVLGTIHGFLHPEVQACSRQLDVLLLQYYSDSSRGL